MAKGSSSVEKDLNIVVSIIKNNSRYNVDAIVKDITRLQEKLSDIKGLVDTTIKLKIDGVNNIKEASNALNSMNRVLGGGSGGLADKITKTFNAINNGISKIGDSTALINLQNNLSNLITSFQSLNLRSIKENFDSFVKVVEESSKSIEMIIKPIERLTGSFDKLDKKIENSLSSLQRYSELINFINQAASGAAQNFGGAKVPVFKSKETEVIGLISQYEKLDKSINKSFESIRKFESTPAAKIDRGLEKQATSEAKKIERSYLGLTEVISKLNLEYQILSQSQNANSSIMTKLDGIIKGLSAQQQRYNQILDRSKDAARQVENAERARRDAYNEQFNSLKGVIERQIEFVTSAAILAGAAETVRLGFSNILNTLNETGRILTVSRSQFLSLGDTAVLIGQTINDASVKTGSSIKEIGTILKELGSAGLTTEQYVAALDSTLANIIGTESSVVETTRLVASTFNILGDSVTGTGDQVANFSRINDIFARATNESSLEMDQLVQSLKFSITAANESGLNLEELTGILGQLADQGLRGGNAGRALRASLQQLSKDAGLVAKALNIQIDLTKPLDLLDVLKQYSEQIKGQELNVEELGTVFERFGLRGADVFLLLAKNFEKVEGKIKDLTENSQNAAFIARDIKLDTPERQIAIFQENLARLVKSAIEPLVNILISLIKWVNRFAETIRMITESDFPKWILTITLVTLSLKGFLNMLNFVIPAFSFFSSTGVMLVKALADMKTGVAATTSVIGKSTEVIKGFGVAVSAAIPVVLALSAALLAIYYAYEYVANANARMRKEISDTIKEQQKGILENKNLAKSYDDVAKRITEAADALSKGNISTEEYANELNNISELSEEVEDVITKYGNSASTAAEKFKELANQQREAAKTKKDLISGELVKRFIIDNEEAQSVAQRLDTINKKIDITKSKMVGPIDSFLFKFDLSIYEYLKKDVEKDAEELIKSMVDFANKTSDSSLRNAALSSAKVLQQILNPGTVAGLETSIKKFVDVIDIADLKIKDFNTNKIRTELNEFKGILDESTQGFEALQRDYAFKFKIIIPDSEIDEIKKTFDNIPAEVITKQANEKIVNSFNFKGLAQIFKDDFAKNLGIGLNLDSFEKQIESIMSFDTNQEQIEALNKVFEAVIANRIDEIQKIEDKELAEKKYFDLMKNVEKFRGRIIDSEDGSILRQDLLTKAGELQLKQETLRNFIIGKNNDALKEAMTIRRDVIKADQFEVSLAKQSLDLLNNSLKATKFEKDIRELEPKEQQFVLELLGRKITLTKELTNANEKLRQDRTRIRRDLEESELSLENQKRLGSTIADQSFRDLQNIKLRRKFLDENKKRGINPQIIQTEINKLKEKENEIERTILISRRDSLLELTKTRQGFFEFIDINNTRLKQQNELIASYQELLTIQNDLNNANVNGLQKQDQIFQLLKKSSSIQLSILNTARELSRFETKQYENAEKLLSVREKFNKETEKIFQQNVDNIADPLTKILNQFFEDGNFSSTLAFVKSIGGGFQDVDKYLGNSNLAAQDFLKFLRQGKIDLSDYPVKLQEIAKAYKTANDELVNAKKTQNEINSQRFAILEKNFSIAIRRGTQEGFDRASSILSNLTELSTIIDPETGRIDKSRSELLLSRVLELQKELDNYDFEKNVDPLNNSLAVAVTNADLLSRALQQIAVDLKNLNAAGIDAFSANKAFNISINGNVGDSNNPVRRSSGGFIPGTGSGDIVPAMLEPGEFVIPKKIVSQKGADFFYNLIGGVPQKGYALGGIVRGYQKGGIVDPGDRIPSGENAYLIIEALNNVNENLTYLYNIDRANGENYLKPIRDSIAPNISNIKSAIYEVRDNTGESLIMLKNILGALDEDYKMAVENKSNVDQNSGITKKEVDDILKFLDESVQTSGSYNTKFLSRGGFISGTGSGDIIPAMLEPGEFVIPKRVVDEKGLEFFYKLISMKPQKYRTGGAVDRNISLAPYSYAGGSITGDPSPVESTKLDENSIKLEQLTKIINDNNINISELSSVILKAIEIYNKQRSIKLQDVVNDSKTTAMRDSAVDEILASPIPKKQQKNFEDLANEYLPLYSKFEKLIAGVAEKYKSYREEVSKAGKATSNFFLQASAKSADKFLDKIEQIGDSFKELFTKELPGFLSFFLTDIIKANAMILSNYNKTKDLIVKNYKDQRADLIEQLKRNQISYFDFFDKLEDLQENQRKEEIDAEEEKNRQIQDQLSSVFIEISRKIAEISNDIFDTIGNAIGGLPALLTPVINSINKMGTSIASLFGSAGGLIGGAIGGITGVVGQIAGGALGIAGQFFTSVAQGFGQLIPIVTDLLMMNDDEFKNFVESINTLPEELDRNIDKLVERIPRIVDAFVNGKIIENVATTITNAVSSAFPEISVGFAKIIISALNSVGPIISNIISVIPSIMTSLMTSSVGVINFVIDFIASGLVNVFIDIGDKFKNIVNVLIESAKEGLKNIFGDPTALSGDFADFFSQIISSATTSIESSSVIDFIDNIFKDLIEFIKNIDISGVLNNVFGLLLQGEVFAVKLYNFLFDSILYVVDKIPEIIDILQRAIIENASIFVSKFVEFLANSASLIDFSSAFTNILPQISTLLPSLIIQLVANFIPTFIDSIIKSLSPDNLAIFVKGFIDGIYQVIKQYFYGQGALGPIIALIFDPLIDIFVGPLFVGISNSAGEIADAFSAMIFIFKTLNDIISELIIGQLSELISLFSRFTKNEKFVLTLEKINKALIASTEILNEIFTKIISSYLNIWSDILVEFTDQLIKMFDLLESSGALGILIDYLDLLIVIMDELYPVLEPVIDFLLPALTVLLVALSLTGFFPLIAILVTMTALLSAFVFVMELLEPAMVRLNPLFQILSDIFEQLEPALRVLAFVVLTALLVILVALTPPLLAVITLIGSLVVIMLVLAAALELFEVIRPAIEQFGQDLQNLAGIIVNAGQNAVNAFTQFINNLINQIPRPAGATDGGGGGGNPLSQFDPRNKFSSGGIVSGMPGIDKIDAKLTRGEYVIKKSIVDKFGLDFFDYLNNGGSPGSSITQFSNYGVYDGELMYNANMNKPKLNEYNANTRDYYLENYLRDTESMRMAGMSYDGQLGYADNSPSNNEYFFNGMMAATDLGEITATPTNNDNISIKPGSNIDRRDEPVVDRDSAGVKVEVKLELDMRGSNFSGDNIANDIESKLAERMMDNKSSISRIMKEMIEEAKVK